MTGVSLLHTIYFNKKMFNRTYVYLQINCFTIATQQYIVSLK